MHSPPHMSPFAVVNLTNWKPQPIPVDDKEEGDTVSLVIGLFIGVGFVFAGFAAMAICYR